MTSGRSAPVLGIVCGLTSEAKALGRWRRDPRVAIGVSGASAARAFSEAERLASLGVRAFLSFGLAGGLDPSLKAGDLLQPKQVMQGGAALPVSPLDGVTSVARLAHAEAVVLDHAEKAALFQATDAAAVDMESYPVAQVAAARGLPVFVIRAVSDPSHRSLPPVVRRATRPDGGVALGAVLGSVARKPVQIPALIGLGADTAKATSALRLNADRLLSQILFQVETAASDD